ncbi:MAG: hypothetical protein R6W78_08005 [Bacteroidales bacterium]
MKKRSFYQISIILISLFLVSGCKKTDEEAIGKWIIGTWELDRYVQQNFKDGVLQGESESLNQGKVKFMDGGTGEDIGGNFIGGDFEWSNTDKELTLITGAGITIYVIEEFSKSYFVFSLTDVNGNDKFIERWYMSK